MPDKLLHPVVLLALLPVSILGHPERVRRLPVQLLFLLALPYQGDQAYLLYMLAVNLLPQLNMPVVLVQLMICLTFQGHLERLMVQQLSLH
jgi:hypothetical protein